MPGALSLSGDRKESTRSESIDVARGIAIILVVFGHNRALSTAWPSLVSGIFLFHVPLFFLLSGRVLRPDHPWRAAPRLARRLLVPFAVAALLVGAAKCVTRGEPLVGTLLGIAWGTGQTLPWSHLWFLPALFLALLATQAVALSLRDEPWRWLLAVLVATIAAAVLPLSSATEPVGGPWSVDLLPLCLLFVWAGQCLRVSAPMRRAALHPVTVVICAGTFAAAMGVARVDFNMREFGPFVPALAAALAGCIVTLKVSQWLCRFTPVAHSLALVGQHSLVIFILHVSLQKALLVAYPGDLHSGAALGILGLASSAVTVALTLLLSLALDRWRARRVVGHAGVASGAR